MLCSILLSSIINNAMFFYVYCNDEENGQNETLRHHTGDNSNHHHTNDLLDQIDPNDEAFWEKLLLISALSKNDNIQFNGNQLKNADEKENAANENQCKRTDETQEIRKEIETDQLNKQNDQFHQHDHHLLPNDILPFTREAPNETTTKLKTTNSRRKSSEIWNHFYQQTVDNVKRNVCIHCKKNLSTSKDGSTATLWDHLVNKHNELYELTNYAKDRKRKFEQTLELPTENGAKRSSKISYEAYLTTQISEVWNHFTRKKIDNVERKVCNYCTYYQILNNSSTSSLWRHLESKHTKIYELTNYAKTKEKQKETEQTK